MVEIPNSGTRAFLTISMTSPGPGNQSNRSNWPDCLLCSDWGSHQAISSLLFSLRCSRHHLPLGQCSVPMRILLAMAVPVLCNRQPQILQLRLVPLKYSQGAQMVSKIRWTSWSLRVGMPAAIHLRTAMPYRAIFLRHPRLRGLLDQDWVMPGIVSAAHDGHPRIRPSHRAWGTGVISAL